MRLNFVCAFGGGISFAWMERQRSQKLNQMKNK
jgi:hypothetical protein